MTGPDASGAYTVVESIGVDGSTAAQTGAIVEGWAGSSLVGPWSGVTWALDTVTC